MNPIPPYERSVQSPLTETLNEDGSINLNCDVTYLVQTVTGPYAVALPNGNYQRQFKRLLIPKARELDSAVFTVTGSFANCTSLQLDRTATSAVLEWDGTGWHLIGGTAIKIP